MIDLPELEEEGIVQQIKEIFSQISKITDRSNFLVVFKKRHRCEVWDIR